ncbi:MAG TPA: hypothetical protein VKV37_10220 [Ktedonobacteraceae bacterium]|jgi:hypothetical protein|nr:hypothetical protein [Ktedonobacteraceae bacterium]
MPDLPPGSEQPQPKRRNSKTHTGDRDTTASAYPQPQPPIKPVPSPQTDAHAIDKGLFDAPRTKSSAVRLNRPPTTQAQPLPAPLTPIPPRSQQGQAATRNLPHATRSGTQPQGGTGRNVHWLLLVGLGMMAMLVLWVTGSWVLAWGRDRYYDIRYGYPRTYQTDAVVGHGGDSPQHPSHFIAINMNREAIIIELMAGNPAKSVVYTAPVYIAGQNGNLAPVTLEFRDVTGDKKVDMIVHIHLQNQDQYYVFVNDGSKFRPSNGNDKIRI